MMDFEEDAAQSQPERNTKRRTPPAVTFDVDGRAEGWAYAVPQAFRTALDIVYSTRTKTITAPDGKKSKRIYQEWTEGDPPLYAFREGDVIGSREVMPGTKELNRNLVQVTQARPDSLDGKRVVSGSVGFRFFEWQDGAYKELGFHICPQAEFVQLLKSGNLPVSIPAASVVMKENQQMEKQSIEFLVQGSKDQPYRVSFHKSGNNLSAYCTCGAGMNGQYCKHRFNILNGVIDDIVSDNEGDLITVGEWLKGSDVEAAMHHVQAIEKEIKDAEIRLKDARKALAAAMRN